MVRQKAAVKEQRHELQNDKEAAVDRLRSDGGYKSKQKPGGASRSSGKPRYYSKQKGSRCARCGRDKHQQGERCPAVGVECHKCKRKGHFQAQCFSKSVDTVSAVEEELQTSFLVTVSSEEGSSWKVDIRIKQRSVPFKMDTGAEVTAINVQTYSLLGKPRLAKPTKILLGPAHQKLEVWGQFTGWLKHGKHSTRQSVYIVQGLKNNLLGLSAITALQLVRRINATHVTEPDVVKRFPKVFNGLGRIGEEYQIKLKENATPYSLFVPRNVPIPLRPKVKRELDRMEGLGVITKVSGLTA